MGRPKKPTQLKVLEGNPGKRPLPKNEPKPPPVAPKCPTYLDKDAKKEWKRVAPMLERMGLLTQVDLAALAAYCQQYSVWLKAQGAINDYYDQHKKLTFEYVNNAGGSNEMPIPELAIASKALQAIKSFCTEFGLTPSSRARISLPDKDDDEDAMEQLLRKRGG